MDRPFMHQKKCGRRQNLAETPYSIVEHIIAIKARCCGVSPHRTCCTLFGGCEQLFIILSLLEPTGLSVKAPETDPGLEGESIPSKTAAYAALHSCCYIKNAKMHFERIKLFARKIRRRHRFRIRTCTKQFQQSHKFKIQ